jgi:hypothetical protein
MENEVIDMIKPTPKLKTKKCNILMYLLYFFLKSFTIGIMLIVYIKYDWFWSFISFLFAYIIIGIIKSKLRIMSIPFNQLEYNYTDKEIATWYIFKHLC